MTYLEFASNIKSDLRKYDSVGLVDDITIVREIYKAFDDFGIYTKIKSDATIEIKDNRGELPENFKQLIMAVKCEPFKEILPEEDKIEISNYFSKLTDARKKSWNSCDECCVNYSEEYIVEKVYFNTKKDPIKYYYKNPTWLRLADGIQVDKCTTDCKNRFVDKSPHSINIVGNKVFTNFNKGIIYLQYLGYPVDKDGFPLLPNSELGSFIKYVETRVKLKILEDILYNSEDTPGDRIGQLIGRLDTQERNFYLQAMTEFKMEGIFDTLAEYGNYIERNFEMLNFQ